MSAPPGSPPVPVARVAFMAPTLPVEAESVATALALVVTFTLGSSGIAPGSYLHVQAASTLARTLLWLCGAGVLIAALAHLSLGVYFLLGGALAVLASLVVVLPDLHLAPTAVPSV